MSETQKSTSSSYPSSSSLISSSSSLPSHSSSTSFSSFYNSGSKNDQYVNGNINNNDYVVPTSSSSGSGTSDSDTGPNIVSDFPIELQQPLLSSTSSSNTPPTFYTPITNTCSTSTSTHPPGRSRPSISTSKHSDRKRAFHQSHHRRRLRQFSQCRSLPSSSKPFISRARLHSVLTPPSSPDRPSLKFPHVSALVSRLEIGDVALHPDIFTSICNRFRIQPKVDLFANDSHHLLPTYFSPVPSTSAAGIDCFTHRWSVWGCVYINPPWRLIHHAVERLYHEGVLGLVIVPYWPYAPWWKLLCSMAIDFVKLPPLVF